MTAVRFFNGGCGGTARGRQALDELAQSEAAAWARFGRVERAHDVVDL